jgi:Tfp pilus assembly protein PilX
MSYRKLVHELLEGSDIELATYSKDQVEEVKLKDVEKTIIQLAAAYVDAITNEIEKKDVKSSGNMQELITPTDVSYNEGTYTIGINAPDYASYQDEGVNGWAVDRGSRFKFKTKGVDPNGQMVRNLKDWIQREGASARNVKVSVTDREKRGMQMKDATTQAAARAAYFIKKKGIKPTRFWSDATKGFEDYMAKELGEAIKIDIINNLVV